MSTEYLHVQLRQSLQVGLPAELVVEVLNLKLTQICPVPGVNPHLLGVTNWRGQLLWSLNLSDCLGLRREAQSFAAQTRALTVVVLKHPQTDQMVACVVSALCGMMAIAPQQIQAVPPQFPVQIQPYLVGIGCLEPPLLLLQPLTIFQTLQASPLGLAA